MAKIVSHQVERGSRLRWLLIALAWGVVVGIGVWALIYSFASTEAHPLVSIIAVLAGGLFIALAVKVIRVSVGLGDRRSEMPSARVKPTAKTR
jgi:hypothetical protein